MKKPAVKYSMGEVGRIRIVEDFLPSPHRLCFSKVNHSFLTAGAGNANGCVG
jgi:hypothetical protein